MEIDSKEWKINAVTDIWTGDYQQKNERLITTGLLGSIRWWFEVLVRGLSGSACDPTVDGVRCPDPDKKSPLDEAHHCVVCELFGCTGWARKFRLMVLSEDGNVINGQIKAGTTFVLCFIPLRPISSEEWCLLDATLRLIADYGAIGGKTVYKPSDEQGRANLPHHRDYGIIQRLSRPTDLNCTRKTLEDYVHESRWRQVEHSYTEKKDGKNVQHDFSWASLQNFWCVNGRYLARQNFDQSNFNVVIGRQEPKDKASSNDSWLAGFPADQKNPASKKVFSFKTKPRTFGFVQRKDNFQGIFEKLKQNNEWKSLSDEDFLIGEQILTNLW